MSTQQSGWYSDPLGHSDRRWFDGSSWTARVIDADGREGIDHLPGVAAPTPAPQPSEIPPPPNSAGVTWAGAAGAGNWDDSGWHAPGSTLPAAPVAPAAWTSPPTLTQAAQPSWSSVPPARPVSPQVQPVTIGLAVVAFISFILSLFVLDWVSSGPLSAGFGDLGDGSASADGLLDHVVVWYYDWLGYLVAAAAMLGAGALVRGRFGAGAARAAHVGAAAVAGSGALLATFTIVRTFRFPGVEAEIGAWLLPVGYFLLLAAVVVSARRRS